MQIEAALYLIPVELSSAPWQSVLPPINIEIVKEIRTFIVENVRTARRCLRRWDREFPIDDCTFHVLDVDTPPENVYPYLEALRHGEPVGVMSEAGCPAVADPGSQAVAIAQRENLRVIPLVGPSSVILSLMASGFNGQGFSFNGYLPIKDEERIRAIRDLEGICARRHQTQIFIETPYRNNRMLRTLADTLRGDTLVCVACDLTDPAAQCVRTLPAARWRKETYDFDKHPAIFLIHRK